MIQFIENKQTETEKKSVYLLLVKTITQATILEIPEDLSVRLALDLTGLRVRAACGGQGSCGACLVQTVSGKFNPTTLAEYQKIPIVDREKNIRLACQLYLQTNAEIYLHNPAPKSNWKNLDISQWLDYNYCPLKINKAVYGVAVDLGTTHIRLSLWDRKHQRRISCRHGNNPQAALGADVLTRLDAQRLRSGEFETLCELVRKAIIEGIKDILSRDMGEVSSVLASIGSVIIVGNTTMLALISGNDGKQLYDPSNWEKQIDYQMATDKLEIWKKSWRMPVANIVLQPSLAGFIGSDTLADLLAINITEQPIGTMLLDFGTNTEIILWDGKILRITSVPGGSAFEGINLDNGLTVETGAIINVIHSNDEFQFKVQENKTPQGFCASGFVDAMALLRAKNIIKLSGRFTASIKNNAYLLDKNNQYTAITVHDIDAFQRAKAATAAAMQQLFKLAGLSQNKLNKLWICGAFGHQLDIHHAQAVGLIPTIEIGKINLFANATLAGCEKILLDANSKKTLQNIRKLTKVVNLTSYPEYDDIFINNLRLQPLPKES